MRNKMVVVLLSCALIFAASAFSVLGQGKENELKDKKITLKLENQPLGVVFRYLTNIYDVPIGFEESMLDREHSDFNFYTNLINLNKFTFENRSDFTIENAKPGEKIPMTMWRYKIQKHWFTINAENQRLEELLNEIVGQMENYDWEVNDEVVNIFPVKGRDERFEKLLKVNIKNFTFEKKLNLLELKSKINYLPNLKQVSEENKIFTEAGGSTCFCNIDRKLDVDLNFSNLSLKELLNRITKIKRGGWILKKHDSRKDENEKESIHIDI